MKDLLEQLAEERGGEIEKKKLDAPPLLLITTSISMETGELQIEHRHRPSSSASDAHNEFIFSYQAPSKLDWRVYIYPENWSDQVLKFLGSQDIQVGLPKLDPLFMIKSNQPDLLKTYLKSGHLCDHWIELPRLEFRIRTDKESLLMEMNYAMNLPRPDLFHKLVETFDAAIEQLQNVQ